MSSPRLIRWSGLVAILGGAIWIASWILNGLEMVSGKDNKVVYLPYEATGVRGESSFRIVCL